MTQVDFYILDDTRPQARLLIGCRLADKGYQSGERVYIHCDDPAQAKTMDELLWIFREGSFVPHAVHPAAADDRSPVLIGSGESAAMDAGLLINVATEVPGFIADFQRVLEIIDGDPERRQQGRARYRHYKDRGYAPNDHRL